MLRASNHMSRWVNRTSASSRLYLATGADELPVLPFGVDELVVADLFALLLRFWSFVAAAISSSIPSLTCQAAPFQSSFRRKCRPGSPHLLKNTLGASEKCLPEGRERLSHILQRMLHCCPRIRDTGQVGHHGGRKRCRL